MCPIFLNLQDLSGLVRLTILYPKVQPQPSILCPKCFCESRVVFARALGVGFFLGRSCFHGWRLGKATKIRVGNPSFPGFLRFILCILYNIKLIWTPHKESKKFFRLSTSLNSDLWIAQLRAASLLLSAPASTEQAGLVNHQDAVLQVQQTTRSVWKQQNAICSHCPFFQHIHISKC